MPNWCYSNVNITANPTDLDKLENALTSALSKSVLPDEDNYFNRTWLGNLLVYTGMTVEEIEESDISCRGTVEDFTRDALGITIDIESAWCPHFAPIKRLLDYLEIDAEVIYTAEEFGCDIYVTNDPDYVNTMYLYSESAVDCDNYDITEAGLREILTETYGEHEEINTLPLDKLIAWAEYEFDDISIHKCEYCDFEEWT